MGRGFLVCFSEFPDFGFEAEILGLTVGKFRLQTRDFIAHTKRNLLSFYIAAGKPFPVGHLAARRSACVRSVGTRSL